MARILAFINPALSTGNVGDLFIEDSARRILAYDREHSIEIDPRAPITADHIDRINRTEAAVILGTNLWYRHLRQPGRWTFTLEDLRRIRVPIIPLGVGTTRHAGEDNAFDAETLEQLRCIHGSCRLGSARDPRTLEALHDAGITNVVMTGCPTLLRSLGPRWELRLRETPRVVVTVRKGQRPNVHALLGMMRRRGLEPIVAAQVRHDLVFRRRLPLLRPRLPVVHQHDVAPYLHLVETCRGAIGWRLHGNMLHLAHGNPAVTFSNCSRGESFCNMMGLPTVQSPDRQRLAGAVIEEMLERFLDPWTFAAVPARYARVHRAAADFLDQSGLEHRLECCPAAEDPGAAAAARGPASGAAVR